MSRNIHLKQTPYWLDALLWLVFILLSGCATGTAQGKQREVPPQKLLLFQKTPCYGTCPAYNATFYTDGSIYYEGFRYAPVQDTLRLQLTQVQLQDLKATLQDLDYTSLESVYPSPYTDLPSTYFTFYENDREVKRVKHQQEGPEALQRLQENLNSIVLNLVKQRMEQP